MSSDKVTYTAFEPDVETIQQIVGGYFTVLSVLGGKMMYVNEEGALMKLPKNEEASIMMGFPIYGNVLIVG